MVVNSGNPHTFQPVQLSNTFVKKKNKESKNASQSSPY